MLAILNFNIIAQLIINGILFGTMYGVAAIGLSLIFGTMRIMFLAQGSIIILFAYICYWFFTLLGLDPYISLVLIIPIGFALGAVIYQGLFKGAAALEDKNISLLIAVGLMFLLENLMTVFWTADPRTISTSYTSYVFHPMGIGIPFNRLMGFIIAVLATAGVVLFLKKTFIGIAVRAAAEDIEAVTLMGVNPHRVNSAAFAIGTGLAGIAGVELATIYPFDPFFGFIFVLKAMIALAIGGIGSVFGAFLGGIILGLLESMTSFFIGGGWADAASYMVFLFILMFKPEGFLVRSIKKA